MKRIVSIAAALVCATTLGACVMHEPLGPGRLYYDGAYGAYNGGFWGRDGKFYYYTSVTRAEVKPDDAQHFHPYERRGDEQVLASRRNRDAERVANGLPPEDHAELRHYAQ